jgi:hypothetical protein
MKKQKNMTQKVTQKKVTKKQFLLLVAGAVAAVLFGGVLNIFKKDKASASTGYGSSAYGG